MGGIYRNGKLYQNETHKRCAECGLEKPLKDFQVTSCNTLGSWCHGCRGKNSTFYKRKRRLRSKK